jgi:hypothetical protein
VPLAALLELLVYLEHFFKMVDAHLALPVFTAQEVLINQQSVQLDYIQQTAMVLMQAKVLIYLECQHVLFQQLVRVVHSSMLLDAGLVQLDILA